MARGTRPPVVEQEILETVLGEELVTPEQEAEYEYGKYKLAEGMSIPVARAMGKYWENRIEETLDAYKNVHALWDSVSDEYEKCQGMAITDLENDPTIPSTTTSPVDENIVRDNIRVLMRNTYARNPDLSFTAMSSGNEEFIKSLKRTFTFMANKTTHPGINLKQNMRRWILLGHLTNFGVMKLHFQKTSGSREEAIEEFSKIEKELETIDDASEIEERLGQLQALYERMPLLRQKGIELRPMMSKGLLLDPDTTSTTLADTKFAIELVPLDDDFLTATYYEENEDGELCLAANPKHKMKKNKEDRKDVSKESIETEVSNTILGTVPNEMDKLRMKGKVLCYRIYDRMLKRIYLYRSDDMKFPLHAYNDELQLSRFFPFFVMGYSEPIDSIVQPGEASYYIGFAGEINKTNRKIKQMRDSVFGALVYNKNDVDKDEVMKLIDHLNNPVKVKAFGIAKPEGMGKISEMLEVFVPPALDQEGLFNTTNIRTTMNKSSGISEIQQGQQFKTNTTNEAVEFYRDIRNEGLVAITDTVEEQTEDLCWSICEILVSQYTKEEIAAMIGAEHAAAFKNMSVQEFNQEYTMEVAAGSIEKPTSEWKKKEAFEVGQVLGQFGSTAPTTVTKILLRLFSSAFSDFNVRKEDWDQLEQEAAANMTKGVSVPNEQQ